MANFLIQALIQVGISLAIQALTRPEDQTVEQGKITESRITQATMGVPIQNGFGRVRLGGNLIWSGPIIEVRTERETGGKSLGPPSTTQVSYEYFGQFAIAVGEGEASVLRKIWLDKSIFYDATGSDPISTNTSPNSARFIKYANSSVRFYPGSETQDPDPLMESYDTDWTPAYRGLCYVVIANLPLASYGNRIPSAEIEVSYLASQAEAETNWTSGFTQMNPFISGNPFYATWSHGLRKIYVSTLDTTVILDMDGESDATPPEEVLMSRDNAAYLESYANGGFRFIGYANNGWRLQSPAHVFPNGRVFQGGQCPSQSAWGNRLAEFNPFTLKVVSHGTWSRTPITGSNTLQNGSFIDATQTPSIASTQWVGLGFANVVWVFGTQSSGSIYPWCYVTDLGDILTSQKVQGGTGGNYNYINGFGKDRNGYVYVFTNDLDEAANDPDGVCLRFRVEISLGLLGPTARVSWEKFDLFDLGINEVQAAYYDVASGYFLLVAARIGSESTFKICVWDPESNTIIRENDASFASYGNMSAPQQTWGNLSNGYGYIQTNVNGWNGIGSYFGRIDFVSLEVEVVDYGQNAVSAGIGWFHIPGQNTTWLYGSNFLRTIKIDVINDGNTFVDDVLAEVVESVGIDSATQATFDSGTQTTEIYGYAYPGTSSARQALEQMAFAYLFDAAEVDGKLGFFTRGVKTSAATVPESEQGFGARDDELPLQVMRIQEIEIPSRVDVAYLDIFREQHTGVQTALRQLNPDPTNASKQSRKVEIGLAMHKDQAIQTAEKQLYAAWMNRTRYMTTLPAAYLKYDPTDILTFTDEEGVDRLVRITQVALSNAYTVEIEGVLEDLSTYTSVTGGAPSTTPKDTLAEPGPTRPIVLDIPLLRDQDQPGQRAIGLYTAFGAYGDNWGGAIMEKSLDGLNFSNLDVNTTAAPWGYLSTALEARPLDYWEEGTGEKVAWPAGSYHFDIEASITAYFIQGGDQLQSRTREECLAGANALYVGGEIILFSTVTAGAADNEYILSDLLRGVRGTEYEMLRGHRYGEDVALLDDAAFGLTVFEIVDRGKDVQFRTRSNKEIFNSTNRTSVTLAGNTATPYTAANIQVDTIAGAARAPIDITWDRRTRFGGEDDWEDGEQQIAIGERYLRYEVVLYEKTSQSVSTLDDDVLFDFTVTTSSDEPILNVVRSSGNWTTDGFAVDDRVNVEAFGVTAASGDDAGSWGLNGSYIVTTVGTTTLSLSGNSEDGNIQAAPPILTDIEGRVWKEQEESKVYSTQDTTITVTGSEMTAAGYSDGDRLDIAIFQMFYPTADSNVQAGAEPAGERGRPIRVLI